MFSWIFILIAIVAGIWYFSQNKNQINSSANKKKDAIDLLKRRFANGEIDEEEYEERKAVLEEDEYLKYNP